jgi:hypothetical protein
VLIILHAPGVRDRPGANSSANKLLALALLVNSAAHASW